MYPKLLKDEVWFPKHLKTQLKAAFEADDTIFAQERFSDHTGEDVAFNKLLLKIVVEIYADKITSMAENKCKHREFLFGDSAHREGLVTEEPAKDCPRSCPEPHVKESSQPSPQEETGPYENIATPSSSTTKTSRGNGGDDNDKPSSSFNMGGWGSSWSFGGVDSKKQEDLIPWGAWGTTTRNPVINALNACGAPTVEPEPAGKKPTDPDFSSLEGLKIDKHGHIWDDNRKLVGKLENW